MHSPEPIRWADRHGECLFRYALARVHRADLAEDLVQEAFLAALRGRDKFTGASSERTWLIGDLKHKIIDDLRRRRLDQPASAIAPDGWMDELFDATGHWKKAPARWSNPGAAFENAECWSTLSACLGKLPRRLASAFCLREIDELGNPEICAALGISATNMGVMLHRARLRLGHCLDIHWFGGERGDPSSVFSCKDNVLLASEALDRNLPLGKGSRYGGIW